MSPNDFIKKLAPIVLKVFSSDTGILPSVIIGMACLESGYGTSELSKYNNLFGLNDYDDGYLVNETEGIILRVPQEKNGRVYYQEEKMATFNNWTDCVLSIQKWFTRPKYSKVTKTQSYTLQLDEIKAGGYATDSGYVSKITRIIEQYDLHKKFDNVYAIQSNAYSYPTNATDYANYLNAKLPGLHTCVYYMNKYYRTLTSKGHNPNLDDDLRQVRALSPNAFIFTVKEYKK